MIIINSNMFCAHTVIIISIQTKIKINKSAGYTYIKHKHKPSNIIITINSVDQ